MPSVPLSDRSEEGLRAVNDYQAEIIASGDAQAFANFLHPNFIINGPNNQCGDREQVLHFFRLGALSHESYERGVESIAITGDVGIVMGNEIVSPAEGSPLASAFGTKPFQRRFTDIYFYQSERWLFLARQASVVREAKQ